MLTTDQAQQLLSDGAQQTGRARMRKFIVTESLTQASLDDQDRERRRA